MIKERLATLDNIDDKSFGQMFLTVTMAEILEKQGRYEDALAVYTVLLKKNPDDEDLALRVKNLKEMAATGRKK